MTFRDVRDRLLLDWTPRRVLHTVTYGAIDSVKVWLDSVLVGEGTGPKVAIPVTTTDATPDVVEPVDALGMVVEQAAVQHATTVGEVVISEIPPALAGGTSQVAYASASDAGTLQVDVPNPTGGTANESTPYQTATTAEPVVALV